MCSKKQFLTRYRFIFPLTVMLCTGTLSLYKRPLGQNKGKVYARAQLKQQLNLGLTNNDPLELNSMPHDKNL